MDGIAVGLLNSLISKHFNLAEIQELCIDLDIDYENLDGSSKSNRIISLTAVMARHDRLMELINYLQEKRPTIAWLELVSSTISNLPPTQNGEMIKVDFGWTGRLLSYHNTYLKTRRRRKRVGNLPIISEKVDNFVNITTHICNQCASELTLVPLVEALGHPDVQIRKFAVKALGEIGSQWALDHGLIIPALIQLIQSEKEVVVKRQAVWALGSFRPEVNKEQVRNVLVALLIDDNGDTAVRWRAAWALGEIKEGRSDLEFIATRQELNENIRYAAIRSLGFIGAYSSLRKLKKVASQEHDKLQKIAQWALQEIQQKKR